MAINKATLLKRATILLLLGVAVFEWYSMSLRPPVVDLVEYWSAARLLLHGGNPYAPEQMLAVERAVGWSQSDPLLMWNPPWALPFVLPLAWVSYCAAYLLWVAISIAIVVFCADRLWRHYGGTQERRYQAWILALTFLPTVTVIGLGQIGPLLLLGITCFLLLRDSHPFLAGMSTVWIGLKPQLLYLFWIALLLWVIRGKRWAVFAGAVTAFAAAALVALLLRPTIFGDYLGQFHAARVLANPSPNLGTLLRRSISPSASWLQFVPSILGFTWFLWYWKKKQSWEWSAEISLLLTVSLATTSYGWLFDQVTLLPAVLESAIEIKRESNEIKKWSVLLTYVLINAGIVLYLEWRAVGVAYTWVAVAWLIVYLFSKYWSPKRHLQ